MSAETWVTILVGAAAAFVVLAFALAIRAARAQARRTAALQERVDSAKVQLEELRSRYESGNTTLEKFQSDEEGLTRALLEGVSALPPAGRLRFGRRQRVLTVMAVLSVVGAAALLQSRSPETRPAETVGIAPATANASPEQAGPARPLSDAQLERMVAEATVRLQKTPEDAHWWAMLAHSYDMLGRFAESSKAYANLVRLAPDDAQALADYADALAVANGRTLTGEPTVLIERALRIDAKNPKALALAGTAAFERKDYDVAIDYWSRASRLSPDAALRREIEGSVADAKAALRGDPVAERPSTTGAIASTSSAAAGLGGGIVSGRVSLADDLVAKVSPDATVFIYARPAGGSRMPVALLRKRVRDLPVDFTLDDSMAMVPGAKLSQTPVVIVGARVSVRGNVSPGAGDVQGWSAPVPVGTRGVKLEMSEVLK